MAGATGEDVFEKLSLPGVFIGGQADADKIFGGFNKLCVGQETPVRILLARSPHPGHADALRGGGG